MGMPSIRGFQASATPQHNVTVPLRNETPIKDEDRIVPPEIAVTVGEGWYAVTTGPRGERRTLTALMDKGLTAYVPMSTEWVESIQARQKFKREVQRPMLPGYVFVCVADDSGIWYEMRQKHRDGRNVFGINGVVTNNGKACRIATTILKTLADEERAGWFDERRKRALLAESNPEMSGPAVRMGDIVNITDGAFATYSGVAEADSTSGSVRAMVQIFGRDTLVVVPIDQIENQSRTSIDDMASAARLARAEPLSELARSQGSGLASWRVIEEARQKRVASDIVAQQDGERPLRKAE